VEFALFQILRIQWDFINTVACFLVTRQVISGFQIRRSDLFTFTRRSYNYLLHSLTPHKRKTLFSLSCILAPEFFLIIPSSAVSQHVFFSHSLLCPVLVLYWSLFSTVLLSLLFLVPYCFVDETLLVLQSSSKPLNVTLGVPSRGHSVWTVHFPCCYANVILVAARTKVYLAVDWQWTSILPLGNVFIEGCSATDRSSWSSYKHLNNSLSRNWRLSMQRIHVTKLLYHTISNSHKMRSHYNNFYLKHLKNLYEMRAILVVTTFTKFNLRLFLFCARSLFVF
jgi:hypothetical protein